MSRESSGQRGPKRPADQKSFNKNSDMPKGPRAPQRPFPPSAKAHRPKGRPQVEDRSAAGEYVVEGMAALGEYARFKPQAIIEVRTSAKERPAVQKLLGECGLGVKLTVAEPRPAEPLARGFAEAPVDPLVASRAPVAARVRLEPLDELTWRERMTRRPESFVLALDHVHDPRNLGAIARSAGFFGIRTILVPERRQVLLTQASVATAQGGFALCELVVCVNLKRALESLKEDGYWIIGADMDGEPVTSLAGQYERLVLVMGNEETGLAQLTRTKCDRMVAISGARSQGAAGLESLNVSVAAGILMAGLLPGGAPA